MTDTTLNITNNPNNLQIRDLCVFFEAKRDDLKRTVNRTLDQRLKGRLDASDVLQETLIEAIRSLDTYQETNPMPLFDWLRFLVKKHRKERQRFSSFNAEAKRQNRTKQRAIIDAGNSWPIFSKSSRDQKRASE